MKSKRSFAFNMRFLAVILTLSFMSNMLSGCFLKETEGAIFRYDIYENPTTFDPQLAESDVELMIVENGFEGLLRKNGNGELEQGVAYEWSVSEDKLTYTFKLRQDAKWDDGETPVTAHDFVFALRRLLTPQTNAPSAENFLCIKNASEVLNSHLPAQDLGVTAQDDYTLVIELEYENPLFLELLTSAAAMPCNEKFFNEQMGRYGVSETHTLFNGPFMVTTWDPETYVVMRTNEGYASEKPSVAGGLTLYLCENSSEAVQRVLDETTDFVQVTFDEKEELKDSLNYVEFEDTVWSLTFNQQNEYFQNSNIRKGIIYALDTSLLNDQKSENYSCTNSFVPSAVTLGENSYSSLSESMIQPVFNPENAKIYYDKGLEELEQSRLRNLTMIIPDHSNFPILAGILQQQWEKYLGLYINIEPLETDEFNARLSSNDYDLAITSAQASYNNPSSVFEKLSANTAFLSSAQKDSYNALLKEASLSSDIEHSVQKFAQAEQMLIDNAAALPLLFETSYYAIGKDVSGLVLSPFAYRAFVKYAEKPY